ncbi:hypothetical protein QUC31_003821 [Theobroma cacao]|uniref:SAUR family protein n=1 Tax=Theobroma cacao TaxID=3641 RepID=A0A061DK89_THECC|nr:SAUR family protein [Theobroma cacao]
MKKERNYKEGGRAPKGHFVVYVGEEMRRFVVPLSYLRSPPFQQLLEKAAEEFGFDSHNSIVLPCDDSTFQRISEVAAKCS